VTLALAHARLGKNTFGVMMFLIPDGVASYHMG
jgi:hypothetical protein